MIIVLRNETQLLEHFEWLNTPVMILRGESSVYGLDFHRNQIKPYFIRSTGMFISYQKQVIYGYYPEGRTDRV
jgi:hypothetical protein